MSPKLGARKEACAHARARTHLPAHTFRRFTGHYNGPSLYPHHPVIVEHYSRGSPTWSKTRQLGSNAVAWEDRIPKLFFRGVGWCSYIVSVLPCPELDPVFLVQSHQCLPSLHAHPNPPSQPAMHWFGCPTTCALACPCCANPSLQPGSAAATCLTCQPHCAQPVHAFQCDQSLHTLLVQPRRDAAFLGGGLPQSRARCTPPLLTFSVAASCPKRRGNTGARGST